MKAPATQTGRDERPTLFTGPRVVSLANRFPGNVREDLLYALLEELWASLTGHLANPIRVQDNARRRTVTFMGAARFTVSRKTGRIRVSELVRKDGKVVFGSDGKATVVDLPCRLDGFWLEAFLVPWRERIGECLIDHTATGSRLDWMASVKLVLRRALVRSTDWYRLRCRLRDSFGLDPEIVRWCRKGRRSSRNYVSNAQYNTVLAERAIYRRIQDDNPNLIWLYNVLHAEKEQPFGDQPVARMKERLLQHGGVTEAGWRLLANGKEQDFRHIIDFVDEHGGISGRHDYLPKWLRLLGKLRRGCAVPRPLTGLFEHDTYDGTRTREGDRVWFRDVALQPGVLRAILAEGERRLARGSHKRFIEEDVVEVMTWLQTEEPVLDKNQLRQGWKHLSGRAVAWRVEQEACDTLQALEWDSLLPQTRIGAWTVVPLTDAWQLRREALTRRHCADQWLAECLAGNCRLFSVRNEKGKRVATIGIECKNGNWSVCGFRGFANQAVCEALRGLDAEVVQRYADLWLLTVPGLPKTTIEIPPEPLPERRNEK